MTNTISNIIKPLSTKGIQGTVSKPKDNFFSQKIKQKIQEDKKLEQLSEKSFQIGTDIAERKVAAEFEIAFEAFMYNLQFSTVEVDPLMGGGIGEEVFRSQLVDALIQKMRENNPGKISEAIYNKIKKDESYNHNKRGVSEQAIK